MVLSDAERAMLQSWVRRRSSAQSLALRSRIVLESADGHAIAEVARRLGITTDTFRPGGGAFWNAGSTVCAMSPGLVFHGRSPMPMWNV